MRSWLRWSAPFATVLVLAAVAPLPPVIGFDRSVSHLLFALPRPLLSALNVVWIVGALPVTAALVLVATLSRPLPLAGRLRIWIAFAALGLCELAIKWAVPMPEPHGPGVSSPVLNLLSALVNVNAAFLHLAGTFPSGHVARLTFVAGTWTRTRKAVWVGALASVAVVATGGHWVWDAFGGLALAAGWLAVAARQRP